MVWRGQRRRGIWELTAIVQELTDSRPRAETEAWGKIPFNKSLDAGNVTEGEIKDDLCFNLSK